MENASRITNIVIARLGERIAAEYLQKQGLVLLERNWRSGRFGEIDLILKRPDGVLSFTEVKTRRLLQPRPGFENCGFDSIDWAKRRKILIAARSYISGHRNVGGGYSCDAVLVTYENVEQCQNDFRLIGTNVLHIVGAFDSV